MEHCFGHIISPRQELENVEFQVLQILSWIPSKCWLKLQAVFLRSKLRKMDHYRLCYIAEQGCYEREWSIEFTSLMQNGIDKSFFECNICHPESHHLPIATTTGKINMNMTIVLFSPFFSQNRIWRLYSTKLTVQSLQITSCSWKTMSRGADLGGGGGGVGLWGL